MKRVMAVMAAVVAGACTHHQQLSADGSPLEVGDHVDARTREGAVVPGMVVRGPLGGVRVRLSQRPLRELELGELSGVRRESVGRGALDGLLIGLATGAVAGAALAIGTWSDDDPGYVAHTETEAVALGAAVFGALGGLVGALGGAVGQATIYYAMPAQR
jgi:hypothetical protein